MRADLTTVGLHAAGLVTTVLHLLFQSLTGLVGFLHSGLGVTTSTLDRASKSMARSIAVRKGVTAYSSTGKRG